MSSGSHVSAWGWQEIDPLDSLEASRYVAEAVGSTPSTQPPAYEPMHDPRDEKPRPFHVIELCLPSGEEVFGLWDGDAFVHHGHEVEPLWWKSVHLDASVAPPASVAPVG